LIDVALKGCGNYALHIPETTSETTLVATRCEFANSEYGAIVYGSLTTAKFNNCVFHDNEIDGIYGDDNATIHLHGEATVIHSNGDTGISAWNSSQVIIHLPPHPHHKTFYSNTNENRSIRNGGTITNVED
tara:strand:+ start:100 stop:492 length:393 start_codon:yes stop_codon:yes gene_type:complete